MISWSMVSVACYLMALVLAIYTLRHVYFLISWWCLLMFFVNWYWSIRLKGQRYQNVPAVLLLHTGTMPKMFLFVVVYCFWMLNGFFYVTCVRFEFVKSHEVNLCGWRSYKPSINKQTIGLREVNCDSNIFQWPWYNNDIDM